MKPSRGHKYVPRTATARGLARRAAARRKASALRAWLSRVAAATGRPGDGGGEARSVRDAPPPAESPGTRTLPRRTRMRGLRAALLRKLLHDQSRDSGPSGAKPNSPSKTKGDK